MEGPVQQMGRPFALRSGWRRGRNWR